MNTSPSQPAAVRLVLPRGGAGVAEVEVVADPAVVRQWRAGSGLRAYASSEGAACFEAVMAEFDPAPRPRAGSRSAA